MPTPLQAAFRDAYLTMELPSASGAYKIIKPGCSPRVAEVQGPRMLRIPWVAEEIAKAQEKRAKRVEFNADRVLKEIERVATVDPISLFNEDGTMKQISDIPEDVRRAIASIEVIETFEWEGEGKQRKRVWTGYIKKVKLVPKNESLNMAGRHFKMFTDVLDVNVGDLASALDKAKGRR